MKSNKQRVLLGMSGGVDSSVAGYLLREQGYDVVGVTMKVWPQDCISRAEDKCCGPQAVADARSVAHALGIPHYVVDEADQFERLVIDYFASEYQAGRTPNPCVMCNREIKFERLRERAAALDADYIATGHYARIERDTRGRFHLLRAADALDSRRAEPPALRFTQSGRRLHVHCHLRSGSPKSRKIYSRRKKFRMLEETLGCRVELHVRCGEELMLVE